MKIKISTKQFALVGILAAVAIISVVMFSSNNQPSPTGDNKITDVYNSIPTKTGKNLFLIQSENLAKPVDPELVDLDSQIISCSPSVDGLLTSHPNMGGSCIGPNVNLENISGKYLGGQCCGAMKDTVEYHEQLEKLKKYSNIPDIPLDPYKTPVDIAKKWIDYDKNTQLSSSEQATFDEAMKVSMEGPCCCKCWHWYVNSGIGKKLIHDYGYSAQQVADFWDASDICGGPNPNT